MINKEILRQIVAQQKEEKLTAGTVRRDILDEIEKWFADDRIIILTGLRRSGKSTLLKQMMQNKKNYCYVNFEDERFLDFNAQDFEQLNEILTEFYGRIETYFFDEIQNIDKFETFVRRLQDEGKKVIIIGSNASLLSKELGTRLTGRYKSFEIYPFSFYEYLTFNKIKLEKDSFYITQKKVKLIKNFKEYLLNGGLPEYLKNKDKEYVRTLYENILFRDIIARYSIKRQKIIKELVNFLMSNISTTFTYNSLKNLLGLSNAITVKEYVFYLSNSYLLFELQKFDFSIKKQLNSPKKIYVVDPAFSLIGSNFSANKGRILENAVFIELKRGDKEIYYYSGKNECDFLIKEGAKIKEAIQVCYILDKDNKKREIDGLLEVMNMFNLKEGFILTEEQEDELEVNNKKIHVIPTFKWMMKNNNF
ncbi:MAG: ATPase [Candidatus Aenigmarchaeota archaeon CG_4_10_14_0_8_um_filter_37_24]|nr:ATP-binding protein [Candidatus Aenigmarchaeota archaeon]PIV68101.1 MAG: ATPase [Candidatus Aenigmarchaeota archaeon CG01_land_8_20_14_3_00_37_9]PIW40943.1 MAG: ATPase [Candidatus Aenigmarchaeota archaeon CG15_BIG_FIL_POST_REV_8_21_14_020_37_27]PIY35642.1 MAG: ATPase [Candidatus Aenigmarchaeota archaeon CG_4_10_14_3_um_filter_37_21]PIZ35134.1 MAG: ATPase [Candidatus Aenigmarchaeota archaeon CG_4_10_14_0_8_um_filter_37_24]PJB74602.1 MAG: ATPase [Candidatus Aenigmarchaeota archaeon CG_4_9_14_